MPGTHRNVGGRQRKLPSKAAHDHDVPAADHLLAARTAVATGNWVTERQKCGGKPIRTDASPCPAAGPTPTKLCAWLDPEGLEFARGAYERHTDVGTAPGQRAPSPARRDGSVVIRTSAFSPKLALWAKSEAATTAGRPTGCSRPRATVCCPPTGYGPPWASAA
ncbi:hypothetical protein ACFXKK_32940 [Streptomyces globisporus]|uniref:hypothetical protein n=1 Tax=Streptomyces globisporus TaxID=1908 RepID=UPI00364F5BC2